MDFAMLGLVALFVALVAGLVQACDALGGRA